MILSNLNKMLTMVETVMRSFPMVILFAIIDKACGSVLTGITRLVNALPAFLKIEIS